MRIPLVAIAIVVVILSVGSVLGVKQGSPAYGVCINLSVIGLVIFASYVVVGITNWIVWLFVSAFRDTWGKPKELPNGDLAAVVAKSRAMRLERERREEAEELADVAALPPLRKPDDELARQPLHPPYDLLRERYERLHADYLLTCERLRKLEAETAPMRRRDGGMSNGDLAGLRIELAQARAEADSYRARMRNGGVDPQEMGG